MFRTFTVTVFACVLTLGLYSTDVEAGKKKRNLAIGIAVGVAATALAISAAQSANANRGRQHYGYNHGVGPQENAVAACIHRADWRVRRKRRGLYSRIDIVKSIKQKGAKLKVTMLVTNFYRNGQRQRWVKCHVKHDRVVFFKYS